jgi:hypothetical protein
VAEPDSLVATPDSVVTDPIVPHPIATEPVVIDVIDSVVPGPISPTLAAPATNGTATGDQPRRSAGLAHGVIGRLRADQRGEGVISAAIAVLIMAFVGVAAFVAYRGIMSSVTAKTTECVNVYVSNGSGCQ